MSVPPSDKQIQQTLNTLTPNMLTTSNANTPNKGKNRVSPLSPQPAKAPTKAGRPRKSAAPTDK